MSDLNGFITLHRKLTEWEWYSDVNTKAVFLHLLLMANWKEARFKGILIPRGSVVRGRKTLAEELNMSEQSIRTSINHLKSTNEITIKPTNKFTIYHIVNYDKYQDKENQLTNKSTKKLTINQPTTNQQLTTNEQVKQSNNILLLDSANNKNRGMRSDLTVFSPLARKWNKLFPSRKIIKSTKARRQKEKRRLDEFGIDQLEKALELVKDSKFLNGENQRGWKATYEWFIGSEENVLKILEGKYNQQAESWRESFRRETHE